MAGVAVDRRRVPLPVAGQHVGRALAMAVPAAVLTGCGAMRWWDGADRQRLPGGPQASRSWRSPCSLSEPEWPTVCISVPKQDTATITLTDLPSPPATHGVADVRINPPDLVSSRRTG
ncbi:hypothetical protein I553_4009 [Mycobacterium xenopi 4042]|uniref:Uncharacterized protein n=1 Tax=Mycobacterium xenopi 4042 TaxID=1299334 RepID=X8BC88_MYCXE|nr:hypothetical protein I553_4009 [Mycobacterium xenopi 4042]